MPGHGPCTQNIGASAPNARKLGKHALYKSLPIEKIQVLVTNQSQENEPILESIRSKGVRVILAKRPEV